MSHPKDDYSKLHEYCKELERNLYKAIDRIRQLEEEANNHKELLQCHEDDWK